MRNWEFYHFTIRFSSQMVPTLPQGAAHAKLCYLFKADVFKGKTLPTEKLRAMSLIVYQLLLLFNFGWSSIHKESLKMYMEKLLPPLPAPCPLLPAFMIWLNNPKLQKEKDKPSKLLFLHLVILTPFWGFPTGWQTFATSDVGNTAHCSSWAHTGWILFHSRRDDFRAHSVGHRLEMVSHDFPHGKQCLQSGQS